MAPRLVVEVVGDSRQLERTLGRTEKRLDKFGKKTQALQGARGVLSTTGGKGGFLFGSSAFIGGAIAGNALKQSISAASDLNEQLSKSNVVFGKNGKAVEDWSSQLATSFGVAQTQALEAASTFGALFRNAGRDTADAARLAQSVVQLGADLASFNNTTVDDALQALRSGLSGEIEPLRRFQVFLTEAAVAQRAMTDTGKKSTKQLTQGEKITARYELILQQTKRAQGDFARTSGGLANQQRILSAQFANLQTKLGKGLLPVMVKLTTTANQATTALGPFGRALDKAGINANNFGTLLGHLVVPPQVDAALKITNKILGDNAKKTKQAARGWDDFTAAMQKFGALPIAAIARGFDIAESRGQAAAGSRARPKSLITTLPNQLASNTIDARLSGNTAKLRAALAQDAKALRSALKDPRLRGAQRIQLKQELLGVVEEIKGIDDDALQQAKDKKQAAADVRKKQAAAAKAAAAKLAAANKALIAKFKDQADAIKSAVLDAFDTKTDKIQNARALEDAKKALRVARQIGGPQGIKLAQRDVTDAQRAIRRQQIEATTFRVGQGPAGPVNRVSVGTQNFYITTADPEQAAREVLRLTGWKKGAGAPQARGRRPGRQAY